MNQNTKALLRSLTTALVCVAIVFAFFISGIRLLGFQVYGVLTGSMVPAYPIGSLIYVREIDPNDLELRDVITYSSGKTIVTHRIVEIVRDDNNPYQLKFRTKGDANNDPDASLVGPADIIGKVAFGIPHLGTIANYIQNPPGLYVTIFAGLALIGLVIFMDTDDNKKGEGAAQSEQIKLPDMPWLTNLLAKVGITWPKPQPEQPPHGYPPQMAQGYPQQYMQPQGYPQQMPQGYPQQYQPHMAPAQPVAPAQPMQPQYPQQMPQGYSQQYQQPYNTGNYPPVQQMPQGYPQQYQPHMAPAQPVGAAQPMQPQYPQQMPQGYPQQYQQPMVPAQHMGAAQPLPQQYPQQGYQQYAAPLERPKNPLE